MHSRTDVVQNRDWQRGAVSLGEPLGETGRNCRGTIVVTCKGTNLFEKHKMIMDIFYKSLGLIDLKVQSGRTALT